MNKFFNKQLVTNLIEWQWVESLFNWTLKSGGTIASILFLASGIWLSVSNSVKGFIHAIMDDSVSTFITYLAKTSFTALPEIILFLSALNTLDQIRMIRASEKGTIEHKMAWTWAYLFGIPTAGFIGYALFNIGGSLLQADYEMPAWIIVLRGLTCFGYALLIFIYSERGRDCFAKHVSELKEQYADLETEYGAEIDRLDREKDADFERLSSEKATEVARLNAEKSAEVDLLNAVIDGLKTAYAEEKTALIANYSTEVNELSEQLINHKQAVHKLSERAASLELQGLESYPIVTNEWLKNGLTSVTLEVINRDTGHSKRKILAAKLKTSPRNKALYLVSSVVEWLRNTPAPTTIMSEPDTTSNVVNFEEYRVEMEA